jgi:hypothetical protein
MVACASAPRDKAVSASNIRIKYHRGRLWRLGGKKEFRPAGPWFGAPASASDRTVVEAGH